MKFSLSAGLVAAGISFLAGCMGPQGNPGHQPYASEPGGALAVAPQTTGTVSYNPGAAPQPFEDMQAGPAAINPPPPVPLTQSPAR